MSRSRRLPRRADAEPAARRLFGDLVLDGSAPIHDLCALYGLEVPEQTGALAQWRGPAAGPAGGGRPRLAWSGALFSVRKKAGAKVLRVGLSLGPPG